MSFDSDISKQIYVQLIEKKEIIKGGYRYATMV